MALNNQVKKIINDITGDRIPTKIKATDFRKRNKTPFSKAYVFSYPDPVTKSKLDYWMTTPVIVLLERRGNNILALNLQHLTYTYSIKLARDIAKKIKQKKRRIKYEDIKRIIKQAKIPDSMLYFAIRSYRLDKISGLVYVVNMDEYVEALKQVPRKSKKKGLSAAIRLNMNKYYEFIKNSKKK